MPLAATQAEEAAAQRHPHTHAHTHTLELLPVSTCRRFQSVIYLWHKRPYFKCTPHCLCPPHTLLSLSLSLFLPYSLCRPPTNDRRRHRRVTVAPKLKSRQKYKQNDREEGVRRRRGSAEEVQNVRKLYCMRKI